MPPANKKSKDDFNVNTLVKAEDHDKDIALLSERISMIEMKFGTNEKIADTLFEASEKALKMHEMFSSTFIKAINSNSHVQNSLTTLIDQLDRKNFRVIFKRIWGAIWTLIVAVAGVTFGKLVL